MGFAIAEAERGVSEEGEEEDHEEDGAGISTSRHFRTRRGEVVGLLSVLEIHVGITGNRCSTRFGRAGWWRMSEGASVVQPDGKD